MIFRIIRITRNLNVITLIHYIIFLIAAALHEESVGFCLKLDGKNRIAADVKKMTPVDTTKESCLSECLKFESEGVKACEYDSDGFCTAIVVEVAGGDKENDWAVCWKFLDKGESLYAEKQYFSDP